MFLLGKLGEAGKIVSGAENACVRNLWCGVLAASYLAASIARGEGPTESVIRVHAILNPRRNSVPAIAERVLPRRTHRSREKNAQVTVDVGPKRKCVQLFVSSAA